MIDLLFTVIPLGIGAAFTPSLFALQLLIVGNDPWGAKALGAFLGSAFAFGIAVSMLLLGFAQLPTSQGGPDVLSGILRLVAALLIGAGAIYFFIPHPQLQLRVRQNIEQRVTHARPIEFFGITFLLSIKDFSSFILLIPAMHDIAVANVPWPFKFGFSGLLFALALSPLIVPPAMRSILGSRGKRYLRSTYEFTMNRQFTIMGVVFMALTIYLAWSGIQELR